VEIFLLSRSLRPPDQCGRGSIAFGIVIVAIVALFLYSMIDAWLL
jgi:hypothetical protein